MWGTAEGVRAVTRTTSRPRRSRSCGRLDTDVALGGEESLLLLGNEEVGTEAVVLHQEGLAALQAAEELHDGPVFPDPVGRLEDETGMHRFPTQRRGPCIADVCISSPFRYYTDQSRFYPIPVALFGGRSRIWVER